MSSKGVFLEFGLSLGQKVKLRRLARELRQVDLASQARVTLADITTLEHDRYLALSRKERILAILGLDGEEPADD